MRKSGSLLLHGASFVKGRRRNKEEAERGAPRRAGRKRLMLNIRNDLDVPVLDTIIPRQNSEAYDMLEIVYGIVDEREFFEVMPKYAKNVIVDFGRMNGRTVGIVMGAKGAVAILYRGKPDVAKYEAKYIEKFGNPFSAAGKWYVDEIIEPRTTRWTLCRDLDLLATKQLKNPPKKHGNIPL